VSGVTFVLNKFEPRWLTVAGVSDIFKAKRLTVSRVTRVSGVTLVLDTSEARSFTVSSVAGVSGLFGLRRLSVSSVTGNFLLRRIRRMCWGGEANRCQVRASWLYFVWLER